MHHASKSFEEIEKLINTIQLDQLPKASEMRKTAALDSVEPAMYALTPPKFCATKPPPPAGSSSGGFSKQCELAIPYTFVQPRSVLLFASTVALILDWERLLPIGNNISWNGRQF
jgi:hypothetical protein